MNSSAWAATQEPDPLVSDDDVTHAGTTAMFDDVTIQYGASVFTRHMTNLPRMIFFFTIRSVVFLLGLLGNTMTLIIIRRLKHRSNGHILMTYLAVSDLLMLALVPMSYHTSTSRVFDRRGPEWNTWCLMEMLLTWLFSTACLLSYFLTSVDRYFAQLCRPSSCV